MRARLLELPLDLFHSTPPCRREKKRMILFYKEYKEQRNWAGDKQEMQKQLLDTMIFSLIEKKKKKEKGICVA